MKKYEEMKNEYEEMKRGCVKVHDTSSFLFLISHCFSLLICHFSFVNTFSWAGNGASHNARCGTEVRSEPQQDNSAGIASRDINAANYDQ